jgi:hypothetical protein
MRSYKVYVHQYKIPLLALMAALGAVLLALGVWSYPYDKPFDNAPLKSLMGINLVVALTGIVMVGVGVYMLYDYEATKKKFEAMMATDSEALFRRNQIELERLALKLSLKEEQQVLAALKRYRIR